MKYLSKYLNPKDRKIIIYLVMIVASGAMLMILGRNSPEPSTVEPPITNESPEEAIPVIGTTYARPERALEKELEEFLSLVAGAGEVRVMVSALGDRETVFAMDSTSSRSHMIEEDAGGGTRDQRQYSTQEQTVIITDRNGIDQPLVLREISPRVEGIVIIAKGGDDPFVRDALTRAAMAVLGVEAHKIQVLPMAQ